MKKSIIFIFILLLFSQLLLISKETRGLKILIKDKKGGIKEVKIYNKMYAIVIGIDKFKNLSASDWLKLAVKDAKGVKKIIDEKYAFENIIELYDNEATRENIYKTFYGLNNVTDSDALFVFIASHGVTYDNVGYILPYDGAIKKSECYKNISMTQFKEDISKTIKAKHIFYVIDACYGGIIAKRGITRLNVDFEYLKEITKENIRCVLTAGDADQQVLDGGPKGHSVFTGRFIEILENESNYITSSQIASTIKIKVFSDAKDRGHIQTPIYSLLYGMGDFVFITKKLSKLQNVENELSEIEEEVTILMEKLQTKKNKQAQKEIEIDLQKKQALIEKKQFEVEQLRKEEGRRKQETKRLQEIENERVNSQNEREKKFEKLQETINEKRKLLEEISKTEITASSTIKEIKKIKETVTSIKTSFKEAKNKSLEENSKFYSVKFKQVETMIKNPWEKQSEFEVRKKMELETYKRNQHDDIKEMKSKYDDELAKNIYELENRQKELENRIFTLSGNKVSIIFKTFNAEKEYFPISVKSKSKDLKHEESIKYYIKAKNLEERKRKYENIISTQKSKGYIGELKYTFSTKDYKKFVLYLKIMDLTNNNKIIFEKYTEAGIKLEFSKLPKNVNQLKEDEAKQNLKKVDDLLMMAEKINMDTKDLLNLRNKLKDKLDWFEEQREFVEIYEEFSKLPKNINQLKEDEVKQTLKKVDDLLVKAEKTNMDTKEMWNLRADLKDTLDWFEEQKEEKKRKREERKRKMATKIKETKERIQYNINNINYYAIGKGLYIFTTIFPVTNLLFFPYYNKYLDHPAPVVISSISTGLGLLSTYFLVVSVEEPYITIAITFVSIFFSSTYVINLIVGIYRAAKYGGWGPFFRKRYSFKSSENNKKLCFDFGFNGQQDIYFKFIIKL